jgi:phage nucleotide-binding protein
MIKIMSVREAQGKRGPKILAYGESGSGKTTLIASLPGRKLVASVELGLLSIVDADDVDVIEVHDITGLEDLYTYAQSDECKHDWIVIDSITEMGEIFVAAEKEGTKDPRQAYGALIDRIGAALRAFRGVRQGVYITAKEEREVEEGTKRILYRPMMPGSKLGPALPYIFDFVFRVVVKSNGDRHVITATDGSSAAKDRSGKLERIEPCDLGAILNKIQ